MTVTSAETPVATPAGTIPNVAMVCNSLPPYRIHLHRRIVREIPEIRLWTICTHQTTGHRWRFVAPPEIRPVVFGKGETTAQQGSLVYAVSEWRKGGRITRWLIENQMDAVVVCGYNDPGRLRILRWCARNDIPCLFCGDSNIWCDFVPDWKAYFKERLVRHVIRRSQVILACGDCGKAYYRKYGADEPRMFYHPYEPDYELIFSLSTELIEQVKKRYQLADGRRRIIFSGRMAEAKRPDLVVDAFVAMADLRPQWDLIMAGDGELREALIRRVPDRLQPRVIWTGFIDDQPVVSALYRLSDVLVLPSDYEPWALVINEAVAAGLAVVSSSVVGASNELVRDGANGRVFPAGDLKELIECLLDVTDPNRIDAMKAASRPILERWRKRGDPVQGLREAL
jgi:glycosyltransferase involved in cell wall biosynthesis